MYRFFQERGEKTRGILNVDTSNMSMDMLPSVPTTPPTTTDVVESENTLTLLILSHCKQARKMARGRLLSRMFQKDPAFVEKCYGEELKEDRYVIALPHGRLPFISWHVQVVEGGNGTDITYVIPKRGSFCICRHGGRDRRGAEGRGLIQELSFELYTGNRVYDSEET